MSQRYTVMAPDRRAIGQPTYCRAGRWWPGGQEIEVEVLDQDEDVLTTDDVKGERRTFPHPTRLGRLAWASIRNDRQIVWHPVGATVDESLQLQAKYDEAVAKLAATTTRAELAEAECSARGVALEAARKNLAEAGVRIDEWHAECTRVAAERDDLLKQVESLTAPASNPNYGTKDGPGVTQPQGLGETANAAAASQAKPEPAKHVEATPPAAPAQPKPATKGATKRGG